MATTRQRRYRLRLPRGCRRKTEQWIAPRERDTCNACHLSTLADHVMHPLSVVWRVAVLCWWGSTPLLHLIGARVLAWSVARTLHGCAACPKCEAWLHVPCVGVLRVCAARCDALVSLHAGSACAVCCVRCPTGMLTTLHLKITTRGRVERDAQPSRTQYLSWKRFVVQACCDSTD